MKSIKDFLEKTHAAVEAGQKKTPKEDLDKKIMNTVRSWWDKETPGYRGFKDKLKTDPEFFAHNFARAGVGLKDGWEFTKKTLRGYIDIESLEDDGEFWSTYKEEYIRTSFDQVFRDGFKEH